MKRIKILELFGGIGACSKALERLNIPFELADYVEIDKYAVKSFNAMHNTHYEPQDITTWDKDIEVDLICHGSPCQDFSLAGLQAGGDKDSGTRSSLMYETIRIVEKLKPKYVLWENVKNLLSKKHRHNFDAYLEAMSDLGYKNYYQVLNAKDYGIPQNRERVFTISIRNDINKEFVFPEKQELKLRLKDMLEDNVDEKYYLSDKMINYVCARMPLGEHHITTGIHMENKDSENVAGTICTEPGNKPSDNYIIDNDNIIYSKDVGYLVEKRNMNKSLQETLENNEVPNGINMIDSYNRKIRNDEISGTITTGVSFRNNTFLAIKNATKQGYLEATDGDGIDLTQPNLKTRRGRVQKDSIQTLTTQNNLGVVVKDEPRIKSNYIEHTNFYTTPRGSDGKLINGSYNRVWKEEKQVGTINLTKIQEIGKKDNENNLRIRKLTPCECWKLMGFDKSDFEKASKVCSNAQLYKQAGNSIVVNVVEKIFNNLLKGEEQ